MIKREALQRVRALRYDPPGFAKRGARRSTFQSALEQCEQFLTAASDSGYATRPVQLFYALSQAGRAIVAASPHIDNQSWKVSGHGLTASTNVTTAAEVTVTSNHSGLFPTVAAALSSEALVAGEPVRLRQLWPLLPEAAFVPLINDALLPVLLFFPRTGPGSDSFSQAEIAWIPHSARDLYGDDREQVTGHLREYPALRECTVQQRNHVGNRLRWSESGPGLSLNVEWRNTSPPLELFREVSQDKLGVRSYRYSEDYVVTPAIGSMSTGLHPILALWAVLLALSSLARYEPSTWSRIVDIDRSAEASAIENILDESLASIPDSIHHQLTRFR